MKKIYKLYLPLILLLLFGIFPFISQTAYHWVYKEDPSSVLLNPSPEHPLGTDTKGRDFTARLLFGVSLSLWMGLIINFLGLIIGIFSGIILFILLKQLGMQLIESLLAIPFFVLGGILSFLLGTSLPSLIMSFGILMALPYSYMTQSYILPVYRSYFIKKSKEYGYSTYKTFYYHMIPIIRSRLSHQSFMSIHSTIFALASMTFLGFGIKAPTPEWGSLIYAGLPYIKSNPLLLIAPFLLFIVLSSIIYNITQYNLSVEHQTKIHTEKPKILWSIEQKTFQYLVAQITNIKEYVYHHIDFKNQIKPPLIVREDYYLNFPRKIKIKEYIKDVFNTTLNTSKLNEYIKYLDLPESCLYKTPQEISGGMLQRINIILALLLKPEMLIMESPFSSLNPELKQKALNLIIREYKGTLIIIAPYLDHFTTESLKYFHSITKLINHQYLPYKETDINITKPKLCDALVLIASVKNLKFGFSLPSLENKTFSFYQSEIIGIIGYSGIGKTTLGKTLAKIQDPKMGDIYFHHTIKKIDIILQDPNYFNPDLSVYKTLIEPQFIKPQFIKELLQTVELPVNIIRKKMKHLNKSEQYQILVLRAIIYQPQLLVLDEFLDHIPYTKYNLFYSLLVELNQKNKTTLIFISHQQSILLQLCHRIIELQ